MAPKPFSEACERNKQPILEVLQQVLSNSRRVLEIGSGTGQHAVYFARNLPHLLWQTSDLAEYHAGILAWLEEANLPNLIAPFELNVAQRWPEVKADSVFSANTAHIMSWPEVMAMFDGVAGLLPNDGIFCLYGPFNYAGEYTSDSNAEFDQWLKIRDARSGIRDFEVLNNLAEKVGLTLVNDFAMPANNRLLVWRRCI